MLVKNGFIEKMGNILNSQVDNLVKGVALFCLTNFLNSEIDQEIIRDISKKLMEYVIESLIVLLVKGDPEILEDVVACLACMFGLVEQNHLLFKFTDL